VGKKAIKAKVIVAITASLPAKPVSWKYMVRFMKASTQRGRKIDSRLDPGYL